MALIKSQEGTGAGAVTFPSSGVIPAFKLLEVTNDDANNTGSLVVQGETLTIKPGETRWIGAMDSVATLTITGDYRIAAYEDPSDIPAMALLARTATAGIASGAVGTAGLATGALAASVAGRLKMATDYFDTAHLQKAVAAGAMTSAVLTDLIPDNAIDTATANDIIENGALGEALLAAASTDDVLNVKRIAKLDVAYTDIETTGGSPYLVGPTLPDNAYVTKAWYEVTTTFTSGGGADAATIGIGFNTDDAAGIFTATAISTGTTWDAAGPIDCIQDGAAANMGEQLTAARQVEFLVAVEDLTAGNLQLFVEYVVGKA